MQLKNKTTMVTGAGRGIGRAIALAFAAQGSDLVLLARTAEQIEQVAEEARRQDRRAMPILCDVGDVQAVDAAVQRAIDQLGRIDILVNNAGGNFVRGPIADSDPEVWQQVISSNLMGTYHCCRAVVPHMAKQGGGKIINVGSGMGHSPRGGNSAYNTAKAGLWMFTRCLASEVWEQGIAVNELIPGPVLTELTTDQFGTGVHPSIQSEWIKQPEDCVPLALFLASQPPQGPTAQSFSLARRPL